MEDRAGPRVRHTGEEDHEEADANPDRTILPNKKKRDPERRDATGNGVTTGLTIVNFPHHGAERGSAGGDGEDRAEVGVRAQVRPGANLAPDTAVPTNNVLPLLCRSSRCLPLPPSP